MHEMIDQTALAQAGLVELKKAFAVFAQNKQQYPLVYETAWGGVVSSASYVTGNSGDDFGNTYYNDHHFQLVSPPPHLLITKHANITKVMAISS